VGVGIGTLLNNEANNNVAVGIDALLENNSGYENTGLGSAALRFNTIGQKNTAVGSNTLVNNIQGHENTAIGSGADVSGIINNATAIGAGAIVNASNKVRIGNSSVTVIEGQVPFTTPSDGRYKFNVEENVKGLDFILQLRPVTYQFDVKKFDEALGDKNIHANAYDEALQIRRSGFIAQEVEKAANTTGYNFSGIIKPQNASQHYSLSYDAFVVPLVKAMQELNTKVEKLEKENASLVQQIKAIEELRREIDALKKAKH